jgi:O-antigen ligase
MTEFSTSTGIGQKKLICLADGLIVAVAIVLPWSTSATAILLVLWLLTLGPTLRLPDIYSQFRTAAGGLPVLLVVLGLVGMLWADVPLFERWKGFESFLKLLAIPLLFIQFRRSLHGARVFVGYLVSCIALLVISVVVQIFHPFSLSLHWDGVLVKNAASQSGEFVTCIFGLAFLASEAGERRQWRWMLAFMLVILAMLADILYVATGRTALVAAVALLVLFAATKLSRRGIVIAFTGAVAICLVAWTSSPYLRFRATTIWTDIQKYEATNERTSSGERIEFWKKSLEFIRQSPVIGQGTGSIRMLFERAAVGQTGTAGVATANPHNQTLAVGIQLGVAGIGVLWAMWVAHLLLFRGIGLAQWIGLVVVVQNIIGSLFNSHLFDFMQGWVYVIGVGVAGGITLARYDANSPDSSKS